MIATLLRVPKHELDHYLKDSSELEEILYGGEFGDHDHEVIDLDKAWDGIIFLLTGQSVETVDEKNPFLKIFFSNQIINEGQDFGSGPAHYLLPNQVKQINEMLSKLTLEQLVFKFNPKKMHTLGVYPNIWDGDEAFDYLWDNFETLQIFYTYAAKENHAIISVVA